MYKAAMRGFAFVMCLSSLMIALPTIGIGNKHTFSDEDTKAALYSGAGIFLAGVFSTIGEKKDK